MARSRLIQSRHLLNPQVWSSKSLLPQAAATIFARGKLLIERCLDDPPPPQPHQDNVEG